MPSGPPELHEYWCAAGPYDGDGDLNAIRHLQERGFAQCYSFDLSLDWIAPDGLKPTALDLSAIDYLALEWDWGGLIEPGEAQ